MIEDDKNVAYQLHGFCDASNQALSCVVYLRRIINGRSCVAFVQGKAKVVLVNQTNWVISSDGIENFKNRFSFVSNSLTTGSVI